MNTSEPLLDLKSIEKLVANPSLSTQKELTQKTDTLLVILDEENLTDIPPFLKELNTNELVKQELKKKKKLTLFGGQDDLYSVCYVRVINTSSNFEILGAAGDQTRALLNDKVTSLAIYVPESINSEKAMAFITGVLLTNYKYIRKSYIGVDESAQFKRISSVTIINKNLSLEDENVKFALRCVECTLLCRQVLNLRPLEANPETLLEFCKNLAKIDPKVSIEAIVGKELEQKGLNLIYNVGRGAAKSPCLVVLKYEGNPQKPEDLIALVGKGVCFDAGGLNLKATGQIEEMWDDKGGACTVLAAFKGAVEMKLPVNIVCAVAIVENLVGDDAYHPSDIIKSHKGLTVEIGNTDAEGRLILADAMSYAQSQYKPNTLIEFSTLTGAVIVALGFSTAGIFSNSDDLSRDLLELGTKTSERLWRLPIFDEHRDNIRGRYSDLNNVATSGKPFGGASNAAAFLEFFVEKNVNWAHIDIGGTASGSSEKFVYSSGATGFGVTLLLHYLRKRAANH